MPTNDAVEKGILTRLREHARLAGVMLEGDTGKIAEAATLILTAHRAKRKVLVCGNGGSAADAQHIAGELLGKVQTEREPVAAFALTTNSSTLTALANDYGYEAVFERQVLGLAGEGDIVIGLSTSGTSPNVVRALEAARTKGARTIAFTGREGSALSKTADIVFTVPSDSTPRIQESHITLAHIICELVETELAGHD